MSRLPLEGIRILELGMVQVLPYAIKPFGLMGAEVIKVESTVRPDTVRRGTSPDNRIFHRYWNHSGFFQEMNPNKIGITLDLTKPKGVETFKRLVKISDVVAENFTARVMKNFGLNYTELVKIKPDIIMLSSTGWGQQGPWQNYLAYGPNTEAAVGLMNLTGYPDGPSIRGGSGGLGIAYSDTIGSFFGTFAILAALEHRYRTGQGQWIDLSHYEVETAIIGEAIMDYMMNGRVWGRIGNRHPMMAPHGCYRCRGRDDWVAIAVASEEEWQAMCQVMQTPSWSRDKRFADIHGRRKNHDELDRLIEAWTIGKGKKEVMELLQNAGVAAGALLSTRDLLLDPHLKHRGFFEMIPHADIEEATIRRPHMGVLWRMSKTPGRFRTPAPTLGQRNKEFMGELLGMTRSEIGQLAREGIIGEEPTEVAPIAPTIRPVEADLKAGRLREIDPHYKELLGST